MGGIILSFSAGFTFHNLAIHTFDIGKPTSIIAGIIIVFGGLIAVLAYMDKEIW